MFLRFSKFPTTLYNVTIIHNQFINQVRKNKMQNSLRFEFMKDQNFSQNFRQLQQTTPQKVTYCLSIFKIMLGATGFFLLSCFFHINGSRCQLKFLILTFSKKVQKVFNWHKEKKVQQIYQSINSARKEVEIFSILDHLKELFRLLKGSWKTFEWITFYYLIVSSGISKLTTLYYLYVSIIGAIGLLGWFRGHFFLFKFQTF